MTNLIKLDMILGIATIRLEPRLRWTSRVSIVNCIGISRSWLPVTFSYQMIIYHDLTKFVHHKINKLWLFAMSFWSEDEEIQHLIPVALDIK